MSINKKETERKRKLSSLKLNYKQKETLSMKHSKMNKREKSGKEKRWRKCDYSLTRRSRRPRRDKRNTKNAENAKSLNSCWFSTSKKLSRISRDKWRKKRGWRWNSCVWWWLNWRRMRNCIKCRCRNNAWNRWNTKEI